MSVSSVHLRKALPVSVSGDTIAQKDMYCHPHDCFIMFEIIIVGMSTEMATDMQCPAVLHQGNTV